MAPRAASRSGSGYPLRASDLPCGQRWPRGALAPLLVLLAGTVGGAVAGVLVPLGLAIEAVEDCSDRLLARGVAGGDVEELLADSRTLTSQLVNQGLEGGPR